MTSHNETLRRPGRATIALAAVAITVLVTPRAASAPRGDGGTSLEETRLSMGKWIETQQILSKERRDWQQAREVLEGRIDLVRKEVLGLDDEATKAEAESAAAAKKREELVAQRAKLDTLGKQLATAVEKLEADVRALGPTLPEPLRAKLDPLYQRLPDPAAKTRASTAERFQNVLGILNELNKANNEISVAYEVRTLEGNRPSEVKTIYVGLAQAYYVSSHGEAGVGRPSASGWKWEPAKGISDDVTAALEILEGKRTPSFVPLPVRIQ